jgi:tripartite-type tricarboxylate transporter receptor subunit TctC
MNRWSLLFALFLAAPALAAEPAAYPDRAVRLVVPFPPGSVSDIVGRLVGQRLGARIGQPVVVENRAGASGAIGADLVAKAAPDGYTLGMITASTHALAPALSPALPYDPIRDFKPVSMIGEAPYVIVASLKIPAKNVQELVAYAKTKPGQINYGSAGVASVAHLASVLLAQKTGIEITHIPYKSTAQSAVDLISGRLDMQIATVAPIVPAIREGKVRALATTGSKRISALPDVPTVIESGVKDYVVSLWVAIVAPAATPDAAVQRLNGAMSAVLGEADTAEALRRNGLEPEAGPPGLITTHIREEIAMWRALIEKTGIKAE